MQEITENAGEALESILKREMAPEEKCVRLQMNEGGQGSMSLDTEREGDKVFEHNERKVLVVDPDCAQQLEGRKLEYTNSHFVLV